MTSNHNHPTTSQFTPWSKGSDDAHFIVSASGEVVSWPTTSEKLTSFCSADAIGRNIDFLFACADTEPNPSSGLFETVCTHGTTDFEGWMARKDGSSFRGVLHLLAVKDTGGKVVGVAAHLRDQSFQHKADEHSWLLNLLVSTVKDYAIFMLDPKGFVITWNAGAERMKLYKQTEIIGHHFSILYTSDDVDSGKPDSLLRIATERGSVEIEGWRRRKDGTTFWASVVITALFHPVTKALVGFAKVVRDLTERRCTEDLMKANVEESLRRQSEFLASVSHEVRTPLNGVIGMVELLARTALDTVQRSYVDWLRKSGTDLIGLINDILDASKIEAGKMELDEQPFRLRELLDDMLEYALACLSQKAAVQFRPQLDGIPPDLYVLGDRGRLRQILSNLLSNASKFTYAGSVSLQTKIVEQQENNVLVQFRVSDTGIGIAKEDQVKLFAPYAQVRRAQRASLHGTGLGLNISKRLCELMKGSITLESVHGRGSVFSFEITFQRVNDRTLRSEDVVQSLQGHALVVDDNVISRVITSRLVELLGCTVKTVESGEAAIEELRSGHFDIVLST